MLLHQHASRTPGCGAAAALSRGHPLRRHLRYLSAFLVEEEGTASSFRALAEAVTAHGLFCALYTYRGSHYFHTPDRRRSCPLALTQVGRRFPQLGIEHIAAYSPSARPLRARLPHSPDRLPRAAAGRHHRHRRRQPLAALSICPSTTPASPCPPSRTAPPSCRPRRARREILCLSDRLVGNDNAVHSQHLRLQSLRPLRPHFVSRHGAAPLSTPALALLRTAPSHPASTTYLRYPARAA